MQMIVSLTCCGQTDRALNQLVHEALLHNTSRLLHMCRTCITFLNCRKRVLCLTETVGYPLR